MRFGSNYLLLFAEGNIFLDFFFFFDRSEAENLRENILFKISESGKRNS